MGILRESSLTLRFFGDDLIPSEVTKALGSRPTTAAAKGEEYSGAGGGAQKAHTGMWRLSTERRQPGDLDVQIKELLSTLTGDLCVWKKLTAKFDSDLFCGLWLEGFNSGQPLQASTLRLIADRSLNLDLDIYGDSEQETD